MNTFYCPYCNTPIPESSYYFSGSDTRSCYCRNCDQSGCDIYFSVNLETNEIYYQQWYVYGSSSLDYHVEFNAGKVFMVRSPKYDLLVKLDFWPTNITPKNIRDKIKIYTTFQ